MHLIQGKFSVQKFLFGVTSPIRVSMRQRASQHTVSPAIRKLHSSCMSANMCRSLVKVWIGSTRSWKRRGCRSRSTVWKSLCSMQRFGIPKLILTWGVPPQVAFQDKIVAFCAEPRNKVEIANRCGFKDTKYFTAHYLKPLLENGQLQMTIPGKPNSSKQRYIVVGTVQDI